MSEFVSALGFGIVTASIVALGAVASRCSSALTNIFNLAYGASMTVSAFVAYEVRAFFHVDIWVATLRGGPRRRRARRARGGVPVRALPPARQRRLHRRDGLAHARGIMLEYGVEAIAGSTFYNYGLSQANSVHVIGLTFTTLQLVIVGIAVAAMAALHVLLKLTRLGKAMRATAADAELARVSGINSGASSSSRGPCRGRCANPASCSPTRSSSTLDGERAPPSHRCRRRRRGHRGALGAMLGALCVGLVSEISAIWIPQLKDLAALALLALVLLVYPGGIAGGRRASELVTTWPE